VTGVWPAAVAVLLIGGAGAIALQRALFGREGLRTSLALLAVALPLSAIVNLAVKRPLLDAGAGLMGNAPQLSPTSSIGFVLFAWLLSPLTEEAIKLLPLLALRVRGGLPRADALARGFAAGAGFGLGEAVYVAYGVAQRSDLAALPSGLFVGFLNERLLVIFVHAVLTGIAAYGLARGWRAAVAGYAAAVALHAVTNVGGVLARIGRLDAPIAFLQLVAMVFICALILEALRRRGAKTAAPPTVLYARG
jgi:RsiW-degrading membrane proteinase PrsW (M82 family)